MQLLEVLHKPEIDRRPSSSRPCHSANPAHLVIERRRSSSKSFRVCNVLPQVTMAEKGDASGDGECLESSVNAFMEGRQKHGSHARFLAGILTDEEH